MNIKLVPYLTFGGNAAHVMEFYQSVFGGKLEIETFKDTKKTDSDDTKDRIMHACLTTDDFSLMASDSHPEHGDPITIGNNISLSFVGTDIKKLTEYFNKLSKGGNVEMPLEKQFWGDVYGVCVDRFGVHWMVNISDV